MRRTISKKERSRARAGTERKKFGDQDAIALERTRQLPSAICLLTRFF